MFRLTDLKHHMRYRCILLDIKTNKPKSAQIFRGYGFVNVHIDYYPVTSMSPMSFNVKYKILEYAEVIEGN